MTMTGESRNGYIAFAAAEENTLSGYDYSRLNFFSGATPASMLGGEPFLRLII